MKRQGGRRSAWIASHQDDVLAELSEWFTSMGGDREEDVLLERLERLEFTERTAPVSNRRVVRIRAEHECATCKASIAKGTRCWSVSAAWSGGRGISWWYCNRCEPVGSEETRV